jgi:LPXTG-site transpeptidase (sortase) family protein
MTFGMRCAPHYRIGIRTLPVLGGGALILGVVLLIAGLGSGAPTAPAASLALATPLAIASSPVASATSSATRDPRTPIPLGYRIQIPRLGIDLAIAEGDVARDVDQQKTPEGFAFHLPGTSVPGLGSNTYLYAHARTGMFLSLWNARAGDEVFISTPDLRALKYVITDVHRVAPDDVSWVQATAGERLTLQTSTGPNASDPRFVAIAVPATSP